MPWVDNRQGLPVWKENVVSKEDFKKIHNGLDILKIRVASWSALIKIIESCSHNLPKDTGRTDDCLNYAGDNKTVTEGRLVAALTQAKRTTLQGTDLVADIQAVLDLSRGTTSESQGVSAASVKINGSAAHMDTLLRRMERLR
jgi:hypothetical protein